MKYSLKVLNSKFEFPELDISKFECRSTEIVPSKKNQGKKNEEK